MYERLLCSHQLIIIQVNGPRHHTFGSYDTCKSFLDELFGYATVDRSEEIANKAKFSSTDMPWFPTHSGQERISRFCK